jgi:hypothetical protein
VVPGAAFTLALDRVQVVRLRNRESVIDVPCRAGHQPTLTPQPQLTLLRPGLETSTCVP